MEESTVESPWGPALSFDTILEDHMATVRADYVQNLRHRLEKADRTDTIRTLAGIGSRPEDRARLMGYWSQIMNPVCDELGVGWEFDLEDLRSGRPLVHINLKSKPTDKNNDEIHDSDSDVSDSD